MSGTQKDARGGETESRPASGPPPLWLRNIALGLVAAWLVGQLIAGTSFMPGTLRNGRALLELPAAARQAALISESRQDRLAGPLTEAVSALPPDAKVFMVGGLLEDYYLLNYLMYPRRVYVDTPWARINGEQGDPVGKPLSERALREMGATHVIVINPNRDGCRVIPLEGQRHD